MRAELSPRALRELDRILAYVGQHNPQAATRLATRLDDVRVLLERHPFAGRPTRRAGVRRIVLTGLPYVLFFTVGLSSRVQIISIRHAKRRPLMS